MHLFLFAQRNRSFSTAELSTKASYIMNIVAIISAGIVLWLLLIPLTSYCIVDSRHPTKPSPWPIFLATQTLLTTSGALTFYCYSTQSRFMFVTTMLSVGMVVAAAAVDPTKVTRTTGESLLSYAIRFVLERLRRVVVGKVVVFVSAAIAAYNFPQYWYMAVYFVVIHLHYYKMASCVTAEAGTTRPQDAPKEIQRKWAWRAVLAAIVLGLLLKALQTVFVELNYVPEKWSAFGGFTLMSAAIFVIGMFVRSDA